MAQITGGTVSVEDGLKKQEEYAPPRKVLVVLNFSVAEGEDYQGVFDHASQAASNRVATLLKGTAINLVQTAAPETADSPPAGEPQRRTRRTKAQIEADEAARKAGPSPSGSAGGTPTSDDPTGGEDNVIHLPDEGAVDDSFDIEPEPEAGAADESFDIEPEPEAGAAEITDADLNSAVQKKNAEIANPNAIRSLISEYNPDPKAAFQLRQIDKAKRAEFIAKLGKLTKAA